MKNILRFAFLALLFFLPWAPANAQEKAHDCIVIVFDGSGSMKEIVGGTQQSRMEMAKTALKRVLATIPEGTWVGVVAFSGWDSGWKYELGPKNTDRLIAAIDGVKPGGGTPLGEYIKAGADRLLKERDAQFNLGHYKLLVVTDGQAEDANFMAKVAPEVVVRGIRLDVIGLDMDQTHALAQMADSYQAANDAKTLDMALTKMVRIESSSDPGKAGGDDFALVSALPDELASAWISEVTGPKGNWPIGEQAPRPAPPDEPAAAAPSNQQATPQPQTTSADCSVISFGSMSLLGVLIVLPMIRRRPQVR